MDKIEYRAVIEFLTKDGKNTKEIHNKLVVVYNDTAPSCATVIPLAQGISSWLNAPVHKARHAQAPLRDCGFEFNHPPYGPELAASDYFLFHQLNSSL
ncbi:hypothetical protein O3P69_004514 [Scylla paramamosain]|uniref:Mos1 transposase HTH domain-containing protein n=1 Tax=Scylla paramamosain TaxID=85552 RepID=A0AAW0UEP0_SCYPA